MERSGKRRDLGSTEAEMYSKLAEFADHRKPLRTMSQVFDRYLTEALPHLAPRTQRAYRGYIENLRRSFGEAVPEKVAANRIFDYRAARAKQSVVQANREVSCLSAIFREAIGWHAVARNPCHELKRLHEQRRTRYVTDQEYLALYSVASERIQCLMDGLGDDHRSARRRFAEASESGPKRVHGRGNRIPAGQVQAAASASWKADRNREDGNRRVVAGA